MSPTWLRIFLHMLPKFRDFGIKLLFLGIFVNISSIIPQIYPFLTVIGKYFPTDENFYQNLKHPKISQKIETLKTWKIKILDDNTDFSLTMRFYLIFLRKWTLNYQGVPLWNLLMCCQSSWRCLGKGKICFCILFRFQTFEHINISFAIQKILSKMSL